MGISVASTIAPYTGRGEPFTVIKGQFALGLVQPTNVNEFYLAPRIRLLDLAEADYGHSFTISVKGRADGLSDYVYSEPLSGIGSLDLDSVDPSSDYPSAVRLVSETGGPYRFGSASDPWSFRTAEGRAHDEHSNLGSLVADDVQIILHGRLRLLRPGVLHATDRQGILAGYYCSEVAYDHKYWPDGNGWRTTEIHVFDNPQLQVDGSGYEDRLFWDC